MLYKTTIVAKTGCGVPGIKVRVIGTRLDGYAIGRFDIRSIARMTSLSRTRVRRPPRWYEGNKPRLAARLTAKAGTPSDSAAADRVKNFSHKSCVFNCAETAGM
jgi:hypothetical protein